MPDGDFPQPPPPPPSEGLPPGAPGAGALPGRLGREARRLLAAEGREVHRLEERVLPAWLRPTAGEPRWQVSVAVLVAIGLQVGLPQRLAIRPVWLLPALEGALLAGLVVANPGRINRHSRVLRTITLVLVAAVSFANGYSAASLVRGLVAGTEGQSAGPLLLTGAAIWLTNVLVFGLWYWEFDRGGPVARAHARREHADFLFPQMQNPDLAPPTWEPTFFDYLYVSFTNATAFSPTDTMPLTRWAKMLMLLQSSVSVVTLALVIARSVNILK